MKTRSLPIVQDATALASSLRMPIANAHGALARGHRFHARLGLQCVTFLLAVGIVLHGLLGPQLAPRNLATLLAWVHFRGVVVITLLFAGNLICMGCPLTFPREIARRFFTPNRSWPKRLRNKWLAVLLFVTILFAYELFDLWATPRWTAVLVVGYWAAAAAVDAAFKGASFCKHLCPLGQFNFLASTISPTEVTVQNERVCRTCSTRDCIRGRKRSNTDGAVLLRGCELGLFQPKKVGNLDCTFCMDCARACPSDNVHIAVRTPASELWLDGPRAGLGQLRTRTDLAVLAVAFTFGAVANALGMVRPGIVFQDWLASVIGLTNTAVTLAILFALVIGCLPALLLGGASWYARRAARSSDSLVSFATRFAYALIPLGFAIWLSHYCFHFLTGIFTFVPVLQDVVGASGVAWLGEPMWGLTGVPEALVLPLEYGFIGLGVLGTSLTADRIAKRDYPRSSWQVVLPFWLLAFCVAGAALWILSQPMEMRGTFFSG